MAIKIEPLDGPMGAIVHGLDSTKPLSDEDFVAVERAMLNHVARGHDKAQKHTLSS